MIHPIKVALLSGTKPNRFFNLFSIDLGPPKIRSENKQNKTLCALGRGPQWAVLKIGDRNSYTLLANVSL